MSDGSQGVQTSAHRGGGRGDEHRGAGGYWSSTPGVLGEDTGAAGPPGAHVGPFSCR